MELVTDMTAKGFLLAFRRVTARRGLPSVMYSDNARSFKKASKELKEIADRIENTRFQSFLRTHGLNGNSLWTLLHGGAVGGKS